MQSGNENVGDESGFDGVRNRLSNCDLVFADPDNGVFPDHHVQPRQRDSAKRIPLAEARALAEGRAAVIYHHNTRRRGGHRQEIQWWMGQLPGCTCAYYWRRWSNRTFFIVNADDEIERRLTRFVERWGDHGLLLHREHGGDPVVEAYKPDVDRTLLPQSLRRSVTERVENLTSTSRP